MSFRITISIFTACEVQNHLKSALAPRATVPPLSDQTSIQEYIDLLALRPSSQPFCPFPLVNRIFAVELVQFPFQVLRKLEICTW